MDAVLPPSMMVFFTHDPPDPLVAAMYYPGGLATHPSIMLAGIGKSVKYRRLLPLPLPSLFPQEMSSLIYSDSLLTSLTLHAIPKYLTTNHH